MKHNLNAHLQTFDLNFILFINLNERYLFYFFISCYLHQLIPFDWPYSQYPQTGSIWAWSTQPHLKYKIIQSKTVKYDTN